MAVSRGATPTPMAPTTYSFRAFSRKGPRLQLSRTTAQREAQNRLPLLLLLHWRRSPDCPLIMPGLQFTRRVFVSVPEMLYRLFRTAGGTRERQWYEVG